MKDTDLRHAMEAAFRSAIAGASAGHGGPFGAAVLDAEGKFVSVEHNTVLAGNDPTAHAEVNAIREACRIRSTHHLGGMTLIATSEPCPMCLAAASWARVDRICYALPRQAAAHWGFTDDFLYEEFARPAHERAIPCRQVEQPWDDANDELHAAWKKRGGTLY